MALMPVIQEQTISTRQPHGEYLMLLAFLSLWVFDFLFQAVCEGKGRPHDPVSFHLGGSDNSLTALNHSVARYYRAKAS